MNHIFKVIFDKTKGIFVAVSELTKSHGKTKAEKHAQYGNFIIINDRKNKQIFTLSLFTVAIVSLIGGSNFAYAEWLIISGGSVGVGTSHNSTPPGGAKSVTLNPQDTSAISSSNSSNHFRGTTGEGAIAIGFKAKAKSNHSIAIGEESDVENGTPTNSEKAIAFGYKAKVDNSSKNALALGAESYAKGESAISLGYKAEVKAVSGSGVNNSIAIGVQAKVQSGQSIAMGQKATVSNIERSIAIGENTKVEANPFNLNQPDTATGAGQALAVGSAAVAGNQATALGNNVYAIGRSSIAIGSDDNSQYTQKITTYDYNNYFKGIYEKIDVNGSTYGFAKNGGNSVNGNEQKTIYSPTLSQGNGSIAIGSRSLAYADGTTAVGTLAFALKDGATAVGAETRAEGKGAIAVGRKTSIFADNSVGIGNEIQVRNEGGMAYGYKAYATGKGSIAIGTQVYANTDMSNKEKFLKDEGTDRIQFEKISAESLKSYLEGTIPGNGNKDLFTKIEKEMVNGVAEIAKNYNKDGKPTNNAIVIGSRAVGMGESSLAIGRGSLSLSENSIALGSYSVGRLENSLAIGVGARSLQKDSIALGVGSIANGESSLALGTNARITKSSNANTTTHAEYKYSGKNAMAIGNDAEASLENSIALGVGSRTDYKYEDLEKDPYVARGSISIPTSGKTGVISVGGVGQERRIVNVAGGSLDTDAVNVAQLRTLEEKFEIALDANSSGGVKYLSVDRKNSQGEGASIATQLEKKANYEKFVNLKTQQLYLKARQQKGGEKFNQETITKIDSEVNRLKKLLGADANGILDGINTNDSSKNLDAILAEIKTQSEQALSESKLAGLNLSKEKIEALTKDTNYDNDMAKGKDSIAIGLRAKVDQSADYGVAIGYKAEVKQAKGVALGAESVADKADSVALGSESVADRDKGTKGWEVVETGVTVANSTLKNGALTATKAAVSVGKEDGSVTRQIVGVAAGTKDTDAVNVAQLKELAGNAVKFTTDSGSTTPTKLGGKLEFEIKAKNSNDIGVSASNNKIEIELKKATSVTQDDTKVVTSGAVFNAIKAAKPDVKAKAGDYIKVDGTKGDNITSDTFTLSLDKDKLTTDLKTGLADTFAKKDGSNLEADKIKELAGTKNLATEYAKVDATNINAETWANKLGTKTLSDTSDDKTLATGKAVVDYVKDKITNLPTKAVLNVTGDNNGGNKATVDLGKSEELAIIGTGGNITTSASGKQVTISLKDALTGITSISGGAGKPTITFNNGGDKGAVDFGGATLSNIGEGKTANDAVTKNQLDKAVEGISTTLQFEDGNSSSGTVNLKTEKLKIKGKENEIKTSASNQELTISLDSKVTEKLAKLDGLNGKISDELAKKADKTDIESKLGEKVDKSLANLDNAGKAVITGLIDVVGKDGITVENSTDGDNKKTFTVKLDTTEKAKLDGLGTGTIDDGVNKDKTVTGATVKTALDKKADKDGSNIEVDKWQTKLGEITFNGDTGTTAQKLGSALTIKGEATGEASNGNIKVTASSGQLLIQLAKTVSGLTGIEADTVTAKEKLELGKNGNKATITATDKGIDVGGKKITNISDGTIGAGSKDVVTGGQLHDELAKKANAAELGNKADKTDVDNLKNNTIKLSGDSGSDDNKQMLSKTGGLEFKVLGDSGNISSETTAEGVKVKLAKDLTAIGSVTFDTKDGTTATLSSEKLAFSNGGKDTTFAHDGVTIDNGNGNTIKVANDGFSAKNGTKESKLTADGVSAKDGTNESTLTPTEMKVTDGTDSVTTSKDGITADFASGNSNAKIAKDGISFKNGQSDIKLTENSLVANKDGAKQSGLTFGENSIALVGKDSGDAVKLTNVANGNIAAGSKDAITGGQLHSSLDKLKELLGTGFTNTDGTITAPSDIGGTGKNTISGAIQAVNDKVNNSALKFVAETAGTQNEISKKLGETLTITTNDGTGNNTAFKGANIMVEKQGDSLNIALKQATKDEIATATGDNDGLITASVLKDYVTATAGNGVLSYKAKDDTDKKSVVLSDGLVFNGDTNLTASVGDNGQVNYALNTALKGITSISANPNGTGDKATITLGNDSVTLNNKKLSGLAKGKENTDAVTVEQLKTVAESIGATVGDDGTITGPTYDTPVKGSDNGTTNPTSTKKAIDDLITAVNKGLTFGDGTNTTTKQLGDTLHIKADNLTDSGFVGTNLKTEMKDGNILIGFKDKPEFKDLTLKDNNHTVKLTPTDKGLNLSDGKDGKVVISGVKDGDTPDSVVTKGALDNLAAQIGVGPVNGVDGKNGSGNTVIGQPGVPGKNGTAGATLAGPAGKDGLNGTTTVNKVQALRDGVAGTMVYTDKEGNRLIAENGKYYDTDVVGEKVKANDGLWYDKDKVDDNGTPKTDATGQGKTLEQLATAGSKQAKNANEVILSAVNADGSTTTPLTLGNLAGALGKLNGTNATDKTNDAQTKVEKLLQGKDSTDQSLDLNRAATAADLQVLAQAGLSFDGNDENTVHRALAQKLSLKGEGVDKAASTAFSSASGNINVKRNDSQDGFMLQLAKDLVNIGSIGSGATKDAANEARISFTNGNGTDTQPTISVNNSRLTGLAEGKDGTDAVTKSQLDNLANQIGIPTDGAGGINGVDGASGNNGTVTAGTTTNGEGEKGRPGKDGTAGLDGKGPAGRDGLNGTTTVNKVQALRDGVAGTVVYTDKDGNRVLAENGKYYKADAAALNDKVKHTDGLWYDKTDFENDGKLKEAAKTKGRSLQELVTGDDVLANDKVILSAVNPDGKTATPVALGNLMSALGIKPTGTDTATDKRNLNGQPLTLEGANKAIGSPTADNDADKGLFGLKGADLARAATVADLQALAVAGLNFTGDNSDKTVNVPLGQTLKVYGGQMDEAKLSDNNIGVVGIVGGGSNGLLIKLAKELIGLTSAQFGDTGGKHTTINGDGVTVKNGNDTVKLTSDGLDNGGKAIKNVGAGTEATDAINKQQLDDLASQIGVGPVNGVDGKNGSGDTVIGQPGVPGKNGTAGATLAGPAGKDGLNGTTTVNKVQALRDGVAGTMVYTDKEGNRLIAENGKYYDTDVVGEKVKANDGLWYDKNQVEANGTPKTEATGQGKTLEQLAAAGSKQAKNANEVILSAVNADGSTTTPLTLGNLAGALGKLNDTDKTNDAKTKVTKLLEGQDKNGDTLNLNRAATAADLQVLAQAGLSFDGNDENTVHRALAQKLSLKGDGVDKTASASFNGASGNINVKRNDSQDGFTFELAKDLVNIGSIGSGATKGAANEARISLTDGKDGESPTISVNNSRLTGLAEGKDGTDAVTKSQLDNLANQIGIPTDGAGGINGVDGASGNNGTITAGTTTNGEGEKGRPGKDGTTGLDGKGPAGRDGLNGTTTVNKVQALRDGVAGTVVYTDKDGNRLIAENGKYYDTDVIGDKVKANNGLWYSKDQVEANGMPKTGMADQGKTLAELAQESGKQAKDPNDVILSAVNPDGKTATPVALGNLMSALGNLDGADSTAKTTDAQTKVAKLLEGKDKNNNTLNLNRAATAADLQVLAQAGLSFMANDGTLHRPLGTTLKVIGKAGATYSADVYSADNLITHKNADDSISIEIKKTPTFDGLVLDGKGENGQGGKDVYLGVDKDGNLVVKNGVDDLAGKDGKEINDAKNNASRVITQDNINDGSIKVTLHYKAGAETDAKETSLQDGLTFNGDKNITVTTDTGGQVNFTLNKDLVVDSVGGGDGKGKISFGSEKKEPTDDNPDAEKVGTVSVNGSRIKDIADGVDAGDAVNKGQLDTAINDVKDNVDSVKAEVEKGLNIATNDNPTQNLKLGDTVKVRDGVNTKVSAIKDESGGVFSYTINVNGIPMSYINSDGDTLAKIGDTFVVLKPNGEIDPSKTNTTIAGMKVINPDPAVIAGTKPDEGLTVDNIKAGKVKTDSKQAVNGGQLANILGVKEIKADGTVIDKNDNEGIGGTGKHNISDAIMTARTEVKAGNNITVDTTTGTAGQNIYTVSLNDKISVKEIKVGNVTLSSVNQGNDEEKVLNVNEARISNVADGVDAKDAINVGQLNKVANATAKALNTVNKRIDTLTQESRAGIAGAMATASLLQTMYPGKTTVSVGSATFKGESAVALGFSRLSDNGKVGIRIAGMTTSNGDTGGSVSVGYTW